MSVEFQSTAYAWRVITHLGSLSLMLPVVAIAATGLWQSGQMAAMRIWLLALTVAVAVVLATKILFLGWGIGIVALDFTGLSGHTLLATAVLPVFFGWLLAQKQKHATFAGAALGLLIGAAVGISRIFLGTHSVSEVAVAWLAGLVVCGVTLKAMDRPYQRSWLAWLAPLILLFAFDSAASSYLPAHDWEVRIALFLSGHHRPYTRHHLTASADLTGNARTNETRGDDVAEGKGFNEVWGKHRAPIRESQQHTFGFDAAISNSFAFDGSNPIMVFRHTAL